MQKMITVSQFDDLWGRIARDEFKVDPHHYKDPIIATLWDRGNVRAKIHTTGERMIMTLKDMQMGNLSHIPNEPFAKLFGEAGRLMQYVSTLR